MVNRFVKYRKGLKLTQKQLSIQSGVSYASIRRFENTGDISLNSLLKLALAMNCLEDFEKIFGNRPIRSLEELFYDK